MILLRVSSFLALRYLDSHFEGSERQVGLDPVYALLQPMLAAALMIKIDPQKEHTVHL